MRNCLHSLSPAENCWFLPQQYKKSTSHNRHKIAIICRMKRRHDNTMLIQTRRAEWKLLKIAHSRWSECAIRCEMTALREKGKRKHNGGSRKKLLHIAGFQRHISLEKKMMRKGRKFHCQWWGADEKAAAAERQWLLVSSSCTHNTQTLWTIMLCN